MSKKLLVLGSGHSRVVLLLETHVSGRQVDRRVLATDIDAELGLITCVWDGPSGHLADPIRNTQSGFLARAVHVHPASDRDIGPGHDADPLTTTVNRNGQRPLSCSVTVQDRASACETAGERAPKHRRSNHVPKQQCLCEVAEQLLE